MLWSLWHFANFVPITPPGEGSRGGKVFSNREGWVGPTPVAEVPHFQSQEPAAARQLQLELAARGTVHWVSPPNALWIDGGGWGDTLQLFQHFLLSRTTVAVLLVQTQQLFPKAQPPQLLSLKKPHQPIFKMTASESGQKCY